MVPIVTTVSNITINSMALLGYTQGQKLATDDMGKL